MLRNTRMHWLVSGLGLCALFAGQAWAADVYQGDVKFKNKKIHYLGARGAE